jgi:hypothetical protein
MGGDDSMKMDNQPSMGGEEPMKMGGTDRGVSRKIPRSGGRRSTAKKSKRSGKMTKKRRTRRH